MSNVTSISRILGRVPTGGELDALDDRLTALEVCQTELGEA